MPSSMQPHGLPPDNSHLVSAANLRRAATTSTTPGFVLPGHMQRSPAFNSFYDEMQSGYGRKALVSEDHGYGIGDGSSSARMRSHSPSERALPERPLPPVPGSLSFPEPQTDLVTSPIEASTAFTSIGDPLELLRRYNTVFLIDDSISMQGEKWAEVGNNTSVRFMLTKSLRKQAKQALAQLADIAASYDLDGIDAYFLNNNELVQDMRVSAVRLCHLKLINKQGILRVLWLWNRNSIEFNLKVHHCSA